MNSKLISGFVFGLALLSLLFGITLWGGPRDSNHDFVGRCNGCHLSTPEKGDKIRFSRSINFLCLECHDGADDNSHPTGMVPTMRIPDGFILDWNGKMTCVTCHDPHSPASNQYLRTEMRGRDFCNLCHQGLMPMQNPHIGTVSIAHSKRGIYDDNSSFSQILDRVSLECLGCHDGVIASDASYKIVDTETVTYQRDGLSHPIGMDYRKAALRDRELRPVEALSPYIALYDGKVGCASCHNPYSGQHRMLTMNNVGSALCLECHIK